MLSLEQLRKIDPDIANLSDKELEEFRAAMYETVQVAFDIWWSNKDGSKNPLGLSSSNLEEDKIKL